MENIGENILESSETKFMNLNSPYAFGVDYVATLLEKKKLDKITAKKWPLKIDSLYSFLAANIKKNPLAK